MKAKSLLFAFFAVITAVIVFSSCSNPWRDATVIFDPNGGSGTPPAPKTVPDGEDITVPSKEGLHKSGYSFYAWNTKADYSGTIYKEGSLYKTSGKSTLYAMWIGGNYYGGGGYPFGFPEAPVDSSPVDYTPTGGNPIPPVIPTSVLPTRVVYSVTYYADTVYPDGVTHLPDPPDPNITLPTPRATARATGDVPTIQDRKYAWGEAVTVLPKHLEFPTKPDHIFAEWVTHPRFITKGDSISTGHTFNIEHDAHLYALWVPKDQVIAINKIDEKDPLNEIKKFNFDPREVGYDDPPPAHTMKVMNTTGDTINGSLTVTITGDDYAFDISPFKDGDMIAGSLFYPPGIDFTIRPVTRRTDNGERLAVGIYTVKIEIEGTLDDGVTKVYSCILIGFEVLPHTLSFTYNIEYNDTALEYADIKKLTPIKAGDDYTERTARLDVWVSTSADSIPAFEFRPIREKITTSDNKEIWVTTGPGANVLTFTRIPGNLSVKGNSRAVVNQLFSFTLTYDGKTEFDKLVNEIRLEMDVSNYPDYFQYAHAYPEITIHDGQSVDRAIPVNDTNATRFNAYATDDTSKPHALTLNYKQTEDIGEAGTPLNWTAIGKSGANNDFSGSYDGNNKTITDLTINESAKDYQGMFGYSTGTLRNIKLVNANVTGNDYVGGVVGLNEGGTVTGSYFTGVKVEGGTYVGGVVGINYGGTVGGPEAKDKCWSSGVVTGDSIVGGVAGYNEGNGTTTGIVQNSSFSGSLVKAAGTASVTISTSPSVTTSGAIVGGVVGLNNGGTVKDSNSTGNVEGINNGVGGVVGRNFGSGTIEKCYAISTVTGNDASVGGVAGSNNRGSVRNSYFKGAVIGGGSSIGGVVGLNQGEMIENCYATGTVSTGGSSVGGVVGFNQKASTWEPVIQNCYSTSNVSSTVTFSNDGDPNDGYISGIVGTNNGTVQNCYATGSVTASTGSEIGGVVGVNSSGTLENSVALNPSVRGNSNVGRVIGENTGTGKGENIYARTMTAPANPSNAGLNNKDGATINATEHYNNETWWKTAANWNTAGTAFAWDIGDTGVWQWNAATKLPILRNMPGSPAQNHTAQ